MPFRPMKRRLFVAGASLTAVCAARNSVRASAPAAKADDIPDFADAMTPRKPLPLPSTPFLDVTNTAITLAHWEGRPYLLHLWATWCAPCIRELPDISAALGALGAKAPAVVAVNTTGGDIARTRSYYAAHGISHLPVFADPEGALLAALGPLPGMEPGMKGIPRTYVVAADGTIRAWSLGMMRWVPDQVATRFAAISGGPA